MTTIVSYLTIEIRVFVLVLSVQAACSLSLNLLAKPYFSS